MNGLYCAQAVLKLINSLGEIFVMKINQDGRICLGHVEKLFGVLVVLRNNDISSMP